MQISFYLPTYIYTYTCTPLCIYNYIYIYMYMYNPKTCNPMRIFFQRIPLFPRLSSQLSWSSCSMMISLHLMGNTRQIPIKFPKKRSRLNPLDPYWIHEIPIELNEIPMNSISPPVPQVFFPENWGTAPSCWSFFARSTTLAPSLPTWLVRRKTPRTWSRAAMEAGKVGMA